MKNRAIITSALPYANGEIHLGHVASTYIPADVTTRFLRLKGVEAYYVCASDDYGTPILVQSEKKGCPQAGIDATCPMSPFAYGKALVMIVQMIFHILHTQSLFNSLPTSSILDLLCGEFVYFHSSRMQGRACHQTVYVFWHAMDAFLQSCAIFAHVHYT